MVVGPEWDVCLEDCLKNDIFKVPIHGYLPELSERHKEAMLYPLIEICNRQKPRVCEISFYERTILDTRCWLVDQYANIHSCILIIINKVLFI